ncbi:hypothetical protein B0T13DRAFT_519083 [Neurospora crassa]|nr:hypothetical protein B0T13DRAFT_519083 [Neurospora crassa]
MTKFVDEILVYYVLSSPPPPGDGGGVDFTVVTGPLLGVRSFFSSITLGDEAVGISSSSVAGGTDDEIGAALRQSRNGRLIPKHIGPGFWGKAWAPWLLASETSPKHGPVIAACQAVRRAPAGTQAHVVVHIKTPRPAKTVKRTEAVPCQPLVLLNLLCARVGLLHRMDLLESVVDMWCTVLSGIGLLQGPSSDLRAHASCGDHDS